VHRSRLFAQHLPAFGWEPIILTVHEVFYEEALDHNLEQLLPKNQKIEKVNAFLVTRPRLIGDIGLRAFFQLRKKALELVRKEMIDFVYIPIPSFYVSLIGSYLHRKTGVKYGIDYIDPWVHVFPGSEHLFSRHWFSTQLAKWLEPKAAIYASLITGVAEGYYKGVQERNPRLLKSCVFGAMPYGGEALDNEVVKSMHLHPYLFQKNSKLQIVYAGSMLPKAYAPLELIFKAIASNLEAFVNVEFHFIGTGKTPNDKEGFNIKALAEKYGLWQSILFEYPARIPYLDVLVHLEAADGVFILGGTEPHYTPSKTYQGVLSGKPILAVLHEQSSAVSILENSVTGVVLSFAGEVGVFNIQDKWMPIWETYLSFINSYDSTQIDHSYFKQYTAYQVTQKLVELLNRVVG
jgi:hypothetical protein